MVICYPTSPS